MDPVATAEAFMPLLETSLFTLQYDGLRLKTFLVRDQRSLKWSNGDPLNLNKPEELKLVKATYKSLIRHSRQLVGCTPQELKAILSNKENHHRWGDLSDLTIAIVQLIEDTEATNEFISPFAQATR